MVEKVRNEIRVEVMDGELMSVVKIGTVVAAKLRSGTKWPR
jgi:hypothetical protein